MVSKCAAGTVSIYDLHPIAFEKWLGQRKHLRSFGVSDRNLIRISGRSQEHRGVISSGVDQCEEIAVVDEFL